VDPTKGAAVLAIDDMATNAIREIVRDHELPDGGGVRIEAREGSGPDPSKLTISTARRPRYEDQVLEHEDVTLFLEPAAAAYLDDKLLSVETDEGGRMRFVVQEL